jgi:hypothetical protein
MPRQTAFLKTPNKFFTTSWNNVTMNTSFFISQHNRKVKHTRYKASRIKEERYFFNYARTDNQRSQAFALRYKVFCLERNFIPHHFYPDQQQTDEFDFQNFTDHLIGFCAGMLDCICGTMRIIRDPQNSCFASRNLSISDAPTKTLPMEVYYPLTEFRKHGRNIEQVTSLAFTKGIREQMYFGLCKGIYLDAVHHRIDDIFIQANPLMAWLFEAIGFKQLYSRHHAISEPHNGDTHHEIPVIGMHLDMGAITHEFLKYFTLPDPHFLF